MFSFVRLLKAKAPTLGTNELDYLSDCFPWANRIYEAAQNENPEAEYVMSLIYRDGYCIVPDIRLAEIWYKRAISHNWLQIAPAKKDICIEGFNLEEKNPSIY